MIVVWLFLAMPQVSLQFVIVIVPDHTHLLFQIQSLTRIISVICKSNLWYELFISNNSFDQLDLNLFVAGELEIILDKKLKKFKEQVD